MNWNWLLGWAWPRWMGVFEDSQLQAEKRLRPARELKVLINQVQLLGFGKFKKKTVNFSSGFNVVVGPNEAGKSTIQSAIYSTFFGKPKDYERWGVNGRLCRIIVDYEHNKIKYQLIRDLGAQELSLRGEPGDKFNNKKLINNLIRVHLGNADEKIFENTAFIRAHELSSLEFNSSSAIKDRIEALMAGSRRIAASEAVKKLSSAYKRVAGTARQKGLGGEIGAIQARIDELSEDLTAADEIEKRRVNLRARLKQIDSSIAANEKILARLAPLLQAFENNEQLQALSLKRRLVSKRLAEISELDRKYEKLKHEIAGSGMESLPSDADKKILLWEQSLKDRQPLLNKDEKMLNRNKELLKGLKIQGHIKLAGTILSFITGVALAFLYNLIAGIFLVFLGLSLLISLVVKDKRAALLGEISVLEEEVIREKTEIKENEVAVANILSVSSAADVDDFLNKYTDWTRKKLEARLLEEKISLLLAGDDLESIKAARRDLLDEEEKISIKIDKTAQEALSRISATDIIGKKSLKDESMLSLLKAKEEKIHLDGRLRELENEGMVNDIEAEINYLENKKNQEVLKAKALMTARDNLESAANELSERIVPQLAIRSKEYFRKFTADQDRELTLDDQLCITLAGKIELSSERLSTGTRDQVFFALRLAIAELIFAEAKPPLILDDPFVYFDKDRLKKTTAILEEIAKEQQIILFTHTNQFGDVPRIRQIKLEND